MTLASSPLVGSESSGPSQGGRLSFRVLVAGWRLLNCHDSALLAVYFGCQVLYAFVWNLQPQCLDEWGAELHKDSAALAATPTLTYLVMVCAALVSGTVLDGTEASWRRLWPEAGAAQRRLGHILLAASVLGIGASACYLPFTPPNFGLFIIGNLVNGAFSMFDNVFSTTLVTRASTRAEVRGAAGMESPSRPSGLLPAGALTGTCISLIHTGVGAGGILAGLSANLSESLGYQRKTAYYWSGAVALVLAVALLILRSPPPLEREGASGEPARRPAVVKVQDAHGPTGASSDTSSGMVEIELGSGTSASADFCTRPPFSPMLLVLLVVSMALTEGAIIGPGFYSVHAFHRVGMTEESASFLSSLASGGLMVARLVLAIAGPVLTPSRVLLVLLPIGGILSFGVFLLSLTSAFVEPGLPHVLLVFCIIGGPVCSSCAYSWLLALYSTCQEITGKVNAAALGAASIGSVAVLNLSGQVLERSGPRAYFLASACSALLSVVSVVVFAASSRRALAAHGAAMSAGTRASGSCGRIPEHSMSTPLP